VANIGVLATFKYWNWLNDNLSLLLKTAGFEGTPLPYLEILLPIGLSFHTFQAMSYTIEVYKGNFKAERHFGIYALYVMFYPQLVAGPIERPQNVLHQFREKHFWDTNRVLSGLQLMGWGLFKKIVVADRMAAIANHVYNNPKDFYGAPVWVATVAFALQIYCDFSGYSDMAIGSAEVMGFRLMRNFNRPYFSKSVAEFWTRWHMSLSTWFRDYLYIPLGGSWVPRPRHYFNLMATFLVSGLWHGASWNFVIWGGLNGGYQIQEVFARWHKINLWDTLRLKKGQPVRNILGAGSTFFLICITWVFFRATTFGDAIFLLKGALHLKGYTFTEPAFIGMGLTSFDWYKAFFVVLVLFMVEWHQRGGSLRKKLEHYPIWQGVLGAGLLASLLLFASLDSSQQFIYFQF
jgi:D-alanyl-lipoteichoic acid acyltransferase DltB (MBOAT superfamily)